MSNINLISEEQDKSFSNAFGKRMVFSILILVLVFILYGTLLFLKSRWGSQFEAVHNQYVAEYDKFLKGNANQVVDFKNRSDISEKILTENNSASGFLVQLEGSVLPAVYLDSLSFNKDKNTLTVSGSADSFNTAAKQIASFQQNEYFSSVTPGKNLLNSQTGRVDFSMDLQIK